jgi:hypothetical protein
MSFTKRTSSTLMILTILISSAALLEASDNSTVNFGANQSITAHSTCKKVTNNSTTGLSVYVPTESSEEWNSFHTNPPSGVVIGACETVCPNGGTAVAFQVCRYSSSGVFTVPSGVTKMTITAVGGGGGFGSIDHSHWNGYGGGGGGGVIKTMTVTPGQVISFSVGGGGNSIGGWGHGATGGNGGTSSVSPVGISASGGRGGAQCGRCGRGGFCTSCPASGGTGNGGDLSCTGGTGRNANYFEAHGDAGSCNGGAGASSGGGGGGATEIGAAGGTQSCGAGGSGFSNHGGAGCVQFDWN